MKVFKKVASVVVLTLALGTSVASEATVYVQDMELLER